MDTTTQNAHESDKFVKGIPMEEEDVPSEDKKEEKPENSVEEKKDTPPQQENKPLADTPPSGEDLGKPNGDETPNRPEKYIPIPQYVSEKKQWNETKVAYEKRIAELEAIKNSVPDSNKSEEAIKKYAETYGVDEQSVRDLVSIVSKPEKQEKKEEQTPTLTPEQQAQIEEAQIIKADKLYEEEFSNVGTPALLKLYPKASTEQLQTAKKELEMLATTKEYLDKPLDYIVWKEQEKLGKLFVVVSPRGISQGKSTSEHNTELTADDFKNATDFTALFALPMEKRDEIVKKMDGSTYTRMKNWVRANDDLEIG